MAAGGHSPEEAMATGDISFATFNLFNLNLPGKAIYVDSDGWTQAEYDRKIRWTADMLQCLMADVYGFQELWHVQCVKDMFAQAGLTGHYDLLAPPTANGTKIVCGGAVRAGLLEGQAQWISDFPADFKLQSKGDDPQTPAIAVNLKGFSRPVLHFRVKAHQDHAAIHVFVCHFKSKGPTKVFTEQWYKAAPATYKPHQEGLGSALSTIRRTAEATALRWMLTQKMKGSDDPVVVLGDLNDGQHSNTLNIVSSQPNYLKPWSRPAGGDADLYSAQALQQLQSLNDVYYTHVYQQARESLDHVLVSEQLYDGSKNHIWGFDELMIENDHLNYEDHKERGTGDHGVVRVQFKYRPAH
jgi:predicted extracellular nuclease